MYSCKHQWNQYLYLTNIAWYDLSQSHALCGYSFKIHFWLKTVKVHTKMKAVLQELQPLACCLVLSSNSIWNIIHLNSSYSVYLQLFKKNILFLCMYVCLLSVCGCLWRWEEGARPLELAWQAVISCMKWVLWIRLGSFGRAADTLQGAISADSPWWAFVSDLAVLSWGQEAVNSSDHLQSVPSHHHWAYRGKLLILLGISVSVWWTRITWWINVDHCSDYDYIMKISSSP